MRGVVRAACHTSWEMVGGFWSGGQPDSVTSGLPELSLIQELGQVLDAMNDLHGDMFSPVDPGQERTPARPRSPTACTSRGRGQPTRGGRAGRRGTRAGSREPTAVASENGTSRY